MIEEVAEFIGRAVLLHKGEIIGDLSLDEIEESERSLIEIIKETYRYRADRVGKAIARMEEES